MLCITSTESGSKKTDKLTVEGYTGQYYTGMKTNELVLCVSVWISLTNANNFRIVNTA